MIQVRTTTELEGPGRRPRLILGTAAALVLSSVVSAFGQSIADRAPAAVREPPVQGGLSLSGPATSVGLTAQHSIPESVTGSQVSNWIFALRRIPS